MPSSNIRDDLPAHYHRVRLLRQVAAAVIRSLPRSRRTASTDQPQHDAQAERSGEPAAPRHEPHALPESPHLSWDQGATEEQRVRERLRHHGNQRRDR